jgi:hypothetical protein
MRCDLFLLALVPLAAAVPVGGEYIADDRSGGEGSPWLGTISRQGISRFATPGAASLTGIEEGFGAAAAAEAAPPQQQLTKAERLAEPAPHPSTASTGGSRSSAVTPPTDGAKRRRHATIRFGVLLTDSGEGGSFDRTAFWQQLADYLQVDIADVQLSVTPTSSPHVMAVSARVALPMDAALSASCIGRLSRPAGELSGALGVELIHVPNLSPPLSPSPPPNVSLTIGSRDPESVSRRQERDNGGGRGDVRARRARMVADLPRTLLEQTALDSTLATASTAGFAGETALLPTEQVATLPASPTTATTAMARTPGEDREGRWRVSSREVAGHATEGTGEKDADDADEQQPALILANLTMCGEVAKFDILKFVARLASLLRTPSAHVEVLSLAPVPSSHATETAARTAARIARHALALLPPDGVPAELTARLRGAEHAADDAAAIARRASSAVLLQVRVRVPRSTAHARRELFLGADMAALNAALGVELLRPVTFRTI